MLQVSSGVRSRTSVRRLGVGFKFGPNTKFHNARLEKAFVGSTVYTENRKALLTMVTGNMTYGSYNPVHPLKNPDSNGLALLQALEHRPE